MKSLLVTLWLGVRLTLLLPIGRQLRPGTQFWPLLALQVGSTVVIARLYAPESALFDPMGMQSDAFLALLTLASAVLAATLLRRPVLAWSLAVLWLSAGLWLGWAWVLIEWSMTQLGVELGAYPWAVRLALLGWWLLILRRSLDGLVAELSWIKRGAAALAAALLSGLPALLLPLSGYYQLPYAAMPAAAYVNTDQPKLQPWPLSTSPEVLLADQAQLVERALGRLQMQDPTVTDAYLLAFGGDGSETVFRNEVEYAQALFEQRFGMSGHTLALLNHPETTANTPLASLTNLRAALAGIAERMDTDQDILILFMTSHGSSDHQLYVDLLGLPLDQIDPEQLQQVLKDSGIVWKVVVVSACYSGGFVDALADSTTLVITAARSDRPSFGCGVDSDFTYFGRALLIEALNQTADFLIAFNLAQERVAEREAEEELDPSEPQIASTPMIEAALARWRTQLSLGPAVAWPMDVEGDAAVAAGDEARDAR